MHLVVSLTSRSVLLRLPPRSINHVHLRTILFQIRPTHCRCPLIVPDDSFRLKIPNLDKEGESLFRSMIHRFAPLHSQTTTPRFGSARSPFVKLAAMKPIFSVCEECHKALYLLNLSALFSFRSIRLNFLFSVILTCFSLVRFQSDETLLPNSNPIFVLL